MVRYQLALADDRGAATRMWRRSASNAGATGRQTQQQRSVLHHPEAARRARARARCRSSTGCGRSSPRSQGAALFLQPAQDINVGGRLATDAVPIHAAGSDLDELNQWAPKMLAKHEDLAAARDVATDQQTGGATLT